MNFVKTLFNKILEYFHFIVVFILLIAFYPYEFYSAYMIDTTSMMAPIFEMSIVILLVLTFLFRKRKASIPTYLYLVIFMQFMGLVLTNMAKGQGIPVGQMLLKFTALFMVVYLSKTCGLVSFFKKYNRWFFIMAFFAAVSLVLMWTTGLDPLYPFIDMSDDGNMYNYGITFAQYTDASVYRPAGFFDEPGALASWGLFALLMNRVFIKDGKLEIMLMVVLFATMSFGYFVQLAVFIILFMLSGMDSRKIARNAIFIFLALLVVVSALYSLKGTDYDSIYEKTIGRIETTYKDSKSDGKSSAIANAGGDSRKELTLMAIKEFQDNPFWGTTKKNFEGGNNIYEPLALYGIFGTFFFYFPFLFLFVKVCMDKDTLMIKCMIVMLLGFLHRPFHNNLLSHFVIYSFIVMYYQYRIQQKLEMKKKMLVQKQ